VTADFGAYQEGREAGLMEYCQESRGFQEGSAGRSNASVCPADSEVKFLYGYHDGRTLHELESGLRSTNRRLRNHEGRIKQIDFELAEKTNALIGVTTTREERLRLVVLATQLAEERSTLKSEISDLLAQREALQAQLATARQELLTKR
jgi:chromosome segregation ATPase